jgi:hypothetical protein
MAEMKTKPTPADVDAFIASVENPTKREDARTLVKLLGEVTGEAPVMWGPNIVGFGDYHYKYASGRSGDTFVLGFSPRKQNLTLYFPGYLEEQQPILDKLGKHSVGKGCLYIKRLSDTDPNALRRLLESAVSKHRERNPSG